MHRSTRALVAILLAGTCLAPTAASAADGREAELMARLDKLEAEMSQLRADLASARHEQAAAAEDARAAIAATQDRTNETADKLAVIESKPPPDGFKVGAATIKLGGFVRVNTIASRWSDGDVTVGALGKEFYLPQQIPVGGGPGSQDLLVSARQTRISLGATTPVDGKELKGYIEFDFALATAPVGAQRATNPYTPTLRRGFIQYGGLLIGQEWSTFQNVAVLPESTDFVGPLEGTVFNRQAQVRYTHRLSPTLQFSVAIENPETEILLGSAASYTDIDDDIFPDAVGRLDWKPKVGDFSLAGIVRPLRVQDAGVRDSAVGWGVSAAGRVPFGLDQRHDFRFMVTYGHGIGRYLGLGYVADAVLPAPGQGLSVVDNLAGFAAVKIGWTPRLRSTITGSYQWAGYDDAIVINPLANKAAWSGAANLFWTVVKGFDLGMEYRHGVREIVNGETGSLDRLEFAAKYSF
jgi:Porin subfamily.